MIDTLHNNEYYTGAQVRIYFGHILIDEITSIEWSGNSTKRPVYGYASKQFDAVAQGQYIIQGQFLMPFKEVGYLNLVKQQLNNISGYSDKILSNIKNQRATKVKIPKDMRSFFSLKTFFMARVTKEI